MRLHDQQDIIRNMTTEGAQLEARMVDLTKEFSVFKKTSTAAAHSAAKNYVSDETKKIQLQVESVEARLRKLETEQCTLTQNKDDASREAETVTEDIEMLKKDLALLGKNHHALEQQHRSLYSWSVESESKEMRRQLQQLRDDISSHKQSGDTVQQRLRAVE